jgi:outer membrane protein assembly factor BamE (lipoprotein component of BamABCDE complex)
MKGLLCGLILLALWFPATMTGCTQTRAAFLEKQSRYLQQNPKLDGSIRDAILHREVRVGMNQEQVQLSVGEPVHKTWGEKGVEHWFYPAERIGGNSLRMLKNRDMMVRLSFESGILKTIGEGL